MSIKVFLIRHGQTSWNLNMRYCGHSDIPLDAVGRSQAECLSYRLSKEKIDKIYSSDMKRALGFARLVFKDKLIEEIADFREVNFGVFEGLTHQEIMARYPKIYKKWLKNPVNIAIPRGENLNELNKRVTRALSKILGENEKSAIAIVTHGGSIRVVLCKILKIKLKDIWQMKLDLASLNIIKFDKREANIILLNDTSYLNG